MALLGLTQLRLSLNKFLSVMEETALQLSEPLKLAGKKVKAWVSAKGKGIGIVYELRGCL